MAKGLAHISVASVLACALGLPATAVATRHPRKPAPYKIYGHVHSGQGCFQVTYSGNGGWSTAYDWSFNYSNGPSVERYHDSSTYSWDLTSSTVGALCDFNTIPGLPNTGLNAVGPFDKGHERIGYNVNDVQQQAGGPPQTNKCHGGVDAAGTAGNPSSNINGTGVESKGNGHSYVFITASQPQPLPTTTSQSCGESYAQPEAAAPGGRVGNGHNDWFTADSVAVPARVFDTAKEVVVTVSADRKNGPQANCGIHSPPDNTSGLPIPTCSQAGSWQGKLTFKRVAG